jgi:high-affinity iron transporter
VYVGAGLGVAASLALWVLVNTALRFSGGSRDLLEGVTALLAVAVLFYVSYWLIDKVQIKRWNRFIQGKVRGALTGGKSYALVSIAFLAVFREGLETVLFFQALLGSASSAAGGMSALAGFLLGFAVLAAVFIVFTKYGVALPMRPFFILTSAMLYYLAFAFMGAGVHELQDARVVGATALPSVQAVLDGSPLLAGIANVLGFHATAETIGAQALLLAAALAGLVYSFVIVPRRDPEVLPVGTVEV